MKSTDTRTGKLLRWASCYQVSFDSKGDFLSVNTLFSQTFFSPNNEWKGSSIYQSISGAEKETLEGALIRCEEQPGEPLLVQLTHESNDLGMYEIQWEITALSVEDGFLFTARGIETKAASSSSNEVKLANSTHTFTSLSPALINNILNYSLDIICAVNEQGNFIAMSSACKDLWRYEVEELIGTKFINYVFSDDVDSTLAASERCKRGEELKNFENRYVRKDGSLVPMYWTAKWDEMDRVMYCVARDGTSGKELENELKNSEEKYKLLFYKNPQPMWIFDVETYSFLEVNEAAIEQYGYSREEFLSMTIKDIRPTEEVPKLLAIHLNKDYSSLKRSFWKHKKKNGDIIQVEITAYPLSFEGHQAKLVLAYNVTEQLLAEDELVRSNERYIYAGKAVFDAMWDWDIKKDEVYWSEGYETLFGHKLENNKEINGLWSHHIHPSDKERVMGTLTSVIETGGTNFEAEYRFRKADGSYAYVIDRGIVIRNKKNEAYRMIGAMQDHTERQKNEQALKELNASLKRRATELASSNKELERFAYVASHDLQEPLRMVSSFLQLLQKRYKEKLDDKANEYIHFAVDGAERMKVLILDLLKYSRVNTMKEEHELLDLNEVLAGIFLTYKPIVEETQAIIEIERLPTVVGTKTQLVQLFQNLIGNALKYRSERTPLINVGFTEQPEFWQFWVKDNGIGIDPRFYEKIFVIFQRLHHKDEYSGTGIGLAICKKIVERHRGNIWVESTAGDGSTFYFTLKKDLKISEQASPAGK